MPTGQMSRGGKPPTRSILISGISTFSKGYNTRIINHPKPIHKGLEVVRHIGRVAHTGYAWACSPAFAGVLLALISLFHCSLQTIIAHCHSSALLYGLLY